MGWERLRTLWADGSFIAGVSFMTCLRNLASRWCAAVLAATLTACGAMPPARQPRASTSVRALVSAMRHGLSARRVAELWERLGVARSTLVRWRRWWRETFAHSACFEAVRGHLPAPVELGRLPASLLERFEGGERQRVIAMLRVLLPLTTETWSEKSRCPMGL